MKTAIKILSLFLFAYCSTGTLLAQSVPDTLENKKGKWQLGWRNYVMTTVNADSLYDPAAWVMAAGITYQSPVLFHFRLRAGGWIIQHFASYGVSHSDPQTGIHNRYEAGLLDLLHPSRETLLRPEELSLTYTHNRISLVLGRQMLQSPFLNPQDGRMRPGMAEGAYLRYASPRKWSASAAWYWRMAPRSTTGWFGVGESIGMYPSGRDATGMPSAYAGATHSRGIGIAHIHFSPARWSLSFWNTYVENIMNTSFVQVEKQWDIQHNQHLHVGAQAMFQTGTGNGGNARAEYRYYEKGAAAQAYSSRIGYGVNQLEASFNFTRITAQGRFLMPREWGKEPFYTFLPRERNEGYGDVDALLFQLIYRNQPASWQFIVGIGQYNLPPVSLAALNKYSMPDYRQMNLEWRKSFNGKLTGLDMMLLLAFKRAWGDTGDNARYIENKVNLVNGSFVINYSL